MFIIKSIVLSASVLGLLAVSEVKAYGNDGCLYDEDYQVYLCDRGLGFLNGIKVDTSTPKMDGDGAYPDLITRINNAFRGADYRIMLGVDRYYAFIGSRANDGDYRRHQNTVTEIINAIRAMDDNSVENALQNGEF